MSVPISSAKDERARSVDKPSLDNHNTTNPRPATRSKTNIHRCSRHSGESRNPQARGGQLDLPFSHCKKGREQAKPKTTNNGAGMPGKGGTTT